MGLYIHGIAGIKFPNDFPQKWINDEYNAYYLTYIAYKLLFLSNSFLIKKTLQKKMKGSMFKYWIKPNNVKWTNKEKNKTLYRNMHTF